MQQQQKTPQQTLSWQRQHQRQRVRQRQRQDSRCSRGLHPTTTLRQPLKKSHNGGNGTLSWPTLQRHLLLSYCGCTPSYDSCCVSLWKVWDQTKETSCIGAYLARLARIRQAGGSRDGGRPLKWLICGYSAPTSDYFFVGGNVSVGNIFSWEVTFFVGLHFGRPLFCGTFTF